MNLTKLTLVGLFADMELKMHERVQTNVLDTPKEIFIDLANVSAMYSHRLFVDTTLDKECTILVLDKPFYWAPVATYYFPYKIIAVSEAQHEVSDWFT